MNQEVEIKVIVKNPSEVEEKLLKLGRFIKKRKQVDKYFTPISQNYFEQKPVSEYLRVRYEEGNNQFSYSLCHFNPDGSLSVTDEYEVTIDNPQILEKILEKIGMVQKVTVSKNRKYYEIDDFEVTLDHIEELGYFIEVEAKNIFSEIDEMRKACYALLEKAGIEYDKCPNMGYPDMVITKQNIHL